jgi:hypothetical protein
MKPVETIPGIGGEEKKENGGVDEVKYYILQELL